MAPCIRWFASLGLILTGWFVAVTPGAAQKEKPIPLDGLEDKAGLFSAQALGKARAVIREIKQQSGKDLVVQTFAEVPDPYKGQKPAEFASGWAAKNAQKLGVQGIYVLICKDPRYLQVVVNKATQQGGFPIAKRDELAQVMLKKLRESTKAEKTEGDDANKKAQELRDRALLDGVNYVREQLGPEAPQPDPKKQPKPGFAAPAVR